MRAIAHPVLAALLALTILMSSAGALASKASPPRPKADAVAPWRLPANYCTAQPATSSQELLCTIRSHDKAIAVICVSLVVAVLGWVWIDAARRSRAGGREWESNPPRID